jgi:hypothetical protein
MTSPLSKLVQLDPREVWTHEAHDFTPWLLANADALGEILGIDIELTANEHPVGGFALDLIGRDLTNDCVLIVENQLTITDHNHLGQVLTYAAGTSAETIVWMATDFREEHRQVLDWLNALAEGNTRFFGIEIGAVRIDDSPAAPLFKLRAQPNDWAAQIAVAAKGVNQATGQGAFYVQFWERFLERVQVEHPNWTNAKKAGQQNWFTMPCPFKGGPAYDTEFAAGGKLRSGLYLDFERDGDAVQVLYEFLLERKDQIEGAYEGPLSWEELPGRRASRIADYALGDVSNVEEHDAYIDWFFDTSSRLRAAVDGPGMEWATLSAASSSGQPS